MLWSGTTNGDVALRRVERHIQQRFPKVQTKFFRGEHPFAEGLLREVDGVTEYEAKKFGRRVRYQVVSKTELFSIIVLPGPEACLECLIPEEHFKLRIEDKLKGLARVVRLRYPEISQPSH